MVMLGRRHKKSLSKREAFLLLKFLTPGNPELTGIGIE